MTPDELQHAKKVVSMWQEQPVGVSDLPNFGTDVLTILEMLLGDVQPKPREDTH